MALINIRNASFGYSDINIFRDISLEIRQGEIFCIIGPNGCGKTTLLDCILGIKSLQAGEITLNDKSINSIKVSQIARHIAYVPQSHDKTFPYTVMEIVLMGRAAHTGIFSSPTREDRAIAEECLETVGMRRFENRPYTQLSGGEGQLVMLARALAQKAPVIIMDEPTAHLDFKHELTLLNTVVQLVKLNGLTILMATHFPNHAYYFENSDISTRVALMGDRCFKAIGSPSKVLNEGNLKDLYDVRTKIVSCTLEDGSLLKQIIPICTEDNIEEKSCR